MSTKVALLIAQLFDGQQLVRTTVIQHGAAADHLTLTQGCPKELQALDWDIPTTPIKSFWKLQKWGVAEFIPIDEWRERFPEAEPVAENIVVHGEALVICRTVFYQRVKSF